MVHCFLWSHKVSTSHSTYSVHELTLCSLTRSVELLGHSGVRAQIEGFLTAPFLRPFGLELCVADHDEHHRHGWRKATNYGKQSRAFDWIAGTMGERGEASADRIDWNLSVYDPVPTETS